MADLLLATRGLSAGYAGRDVLRDISITVMPGELVALVGHNGAGKSTFLKTLFGMLPLTGGQVFLDGAHVIPDPRAMTRHGVSFAPQGNRVFPSLSVLDNLRLAFGAVDSARLFSAELERLLIDFPDIAANMDRHAGALSGGVRQVLAFAMAMIVQPRILLIDEPCLGLAPALAEPTLEQLRAICTTRQVGAIVVEQRVRQVLNVADRAYVLRGGGVSYDGPAAAIRDNDKLKEYFL